MTEGIAEYRRRDAETLRQVQEELRETLFVEAGAGTGKTRALVERVLALVLGGRPIERIVAITFTEKAAAELRERVRSALGDALEKHQDKAEVIQKALGSLDRAQMSTIHSFAQTLLRSFAAEAEVDPAFTVQDEIAAERRFEERWRSYLDGLAGDEKAVAAIDRVLRLSMRTGDLQMLAQALAGAPGLAQRLEARPLVAPDPFWHNARQMRDELAALVPGGVPADDRLLADVEKLQALLKELAEARAEREDILAAGADVLQQTFSGGRQDNWGGSDAKGAVQAQAKDICERLNECLAACRTQALADVLPLIVRFVVQEQEARGREGLLTFDDLILRARDLLQQDRQAVRALQDRYEALLIDEFQDTDPLQVDIARAFGTEMETGKLRPGRLFLVGDPKQSIYRFRRADMAVYAQTLEWMRGQEVLTPELALNRRSRPEVLAWVNAVFEKLMPPGDPAVQASYRPIHPEREAKLAGPGVAWSGGELAGLKARQIREVEAREVAALCAVARSERWQVAERCGAVREAGFGDIAVLIPNRGILQALERSLADEGIRYRVEGGSLVYRTQEVRDLINCLTAIDDPADEVAVVAALRSPAFACSDVDLARYKGEGGKFDYLWHGFDSRQGRVADGLRVLAQYHARRHKGSLAALVQEFADDRALAEVGILDRGDRNSFRRVRFVVEQARAFESNGPESLRSFTSWMEERSGPRIFDNEGAGVDDDEDAVRIMTVHGAKGLEFPIVFLAGLGGRRGNQRSMYLVDRSHDRVAVRIGPAERRFELGPYEDLSSLEKSHEEAEEARLLYVAATRARDHLVVFLNHKRNTPCPASRLIAAGGMDRAPELPSAASPKRSRRPPFAELELDLPSTTDGAEFDMAREALVTRATTLRYTSATALGRQWKDEPTDESEPWARGRSGTRVGRAVHAAIQSLPLDGGGDLLEAFAHAQAVAEAVPQRARDVAELVRRALGSEAAARARAAERPLREVPFAVQVDGRMLEGFVDLLIETREGIEIVDWKTDDVPAEDVEQRLREYELQAGLYVLGIEAATGRPVTAVTYVFVSAGRELSPGEPAALARAAREALLAGVP